VLDIVDSQVRALRVRQVYELFDAGARKGCYWGIGAMFPKTVPYPCTDPRPEELATVPTRLKALDASVQQRLINWGYIVCDFNLRSRYDTGIPPVRALPYPGAGV
jgi:NTE family protein